jgi:hypothetical protein
MPSLSDILTTTQNGAAAVNNLGQILTGATINSSSIQVTITSTIFITTASTFFLPSSAATGFSTTSGTVTTVNTSIGLTGGPITTTGTIAVSLTTLTNSLSSDVTLNNTSSYFTGPTVSQGTSGKWLAIGQVTVRDNAGIATIVAKLWDGTTVIDSAAVSIPATGEVMVMPLSGVITSPASNISISVRDQTSVSGLILASQSGNAKDSTITVVRIG